MDMVARDLRMAGYGLPVSDYFVSRWVTWVSGVVANPQIVQGSGSAPDTLHIVAALDAPAAQTTVDVPRGGTLLTLQSGQGARFNASRNKLIYIGKAELARVVAVSGDVLTISSDPSLNGKGVRFGAPAGSAVELVKVITYEWSNDTTTYPFRPHLRRHDNTDTLVYGWQKMIANNIEDFQITPVGTAYRVDIRGRTDQPDRHFGGDGYRRMTLTSQVTPRNKKGKF
jgi:hypothetical protein